MKAMLKYILQLKIRPVGQAVKTSPSHGEGMGSIPVGVTKEKSTTFVVLFSFFDGLHPWNRPGIYAWAYVHGCKKLRSARQACL